MQSITSTTAADTNQSFRTRAFDTSARDERVKAHLHLVESAARAFRSRPISRGVEFDDLAAYGAEGLLDAAARFDPTRGVPFDAFARPRIHGAIVDGIRKGGWFGRRPFRGRRAGGFGIVDRAANDPGSPVVLPAGLTDIVDRREAGHGARWNGKAMVLISVEDDDTRQAPAAANLALLSERERRLLELCFYHGKTLTQAAREIGFRLSRASRLRTRALAKLRASMQAHAGLPRRGTGRPQHARAAADNSRVDGRCGEAARRTAPESAAQAVARRA
jgi:RNA polymerase sigma factor (sigma-70 family)